MSEVPQHVPDAKRTQKPPRNPREKTLPDTDTGGGPLMPTAIEQAMEPAEFAELSDISDDEFERQLEHTKKQIMSEVADDSMQRQAIRDVQARHDMRDPSTVALRKQQHEVEAKLEAIKAVRIAERAKQEALPRTIEGDAFTAKEMEAIPQTFDRLDPQRILLYTEVAKELGYQDDTDIAGVHRSYEAMQRSVQDLRLANPKDPKAAQIASLLPRSWQDFLGANPPSPPTGLRGLFKRVSGLFRKAEPTPRQAMLKNILEASRLMSMGAAGRTEMRGSAVGATERTPSLGGMGDAKELGMNYIPRDNVEWTSRNKKQERDWKTVQEYLNVLGDKAYSRSAIARQGDESKAGQALELLRRIDRLMTPEDRLRYQIFLQRIEAESKNPMNDLWNIAGYKIFADNLFQRVGSYQLEQIKMRNFEDLVSFANVAEPAVFDAAWEAFKQVATQQGVVPFQGRRAPGPEFSLAR
ncbi:MAG: hypothetical protein NUV84_03220 [Candidatus Uhrbacteria bacterium]|nr:hypothetical protein [Candidatus Uhrbacteria bacterium]